MKKASFEFEKYQAALNDFVFFRFSPDELSHSLVDFISGACDRNRGIGADGVVFLFGGKNAPVEWRFFNRDGSETKVCGNAARCVALALMNQQNPPTSTTQWQGQLGAFEGKKTSESVVEVHWPLSASTPQRLTEALSMEVSALNHFGLAAIYHVQAGVPHLVVITHEESSPEQRMAHAPQLRKHALLGTEGANVTWLSLKTLNAVTFERGVEAETLACGSGALAAFLALEKWHNDRNEISDPSNSFKFPGGSLAVTRDPANPEKLWLKGHARRVFHGIWRPETP